MKNNKTVVTVSEQNQRQSAKKPKYLTVRGFSPKLGAPKSPFNPGDALQQKKEELKQKFLKRKDIIRPHDIDDNFLNRLSLNNKVVRVEMDPVQIANQTPQPLQSNMKATNANTCASPQTSQSALSYYKYHGPGNLLAKSLNLEQIKNMPSLQDHILSLMSPLNAQSVDPRFNITFAHAKPLLTSPHHYKTQKPVSPQSSNTAPPFSPTSEETQPTTALNQQLPLPQRSNKIRSKTQQNSNAMPSSRKSHPMTATSMAKITEKEINEQGILVGQSGRSELMKLADKDVQAVFPGHVEVTTPSQKIGGASQREEIGGDSSEKNTPQKYLSQLQEKLSGRTRFANPLMEDSREQMSSLKYDKRLSPRNLDLPMLVEDQYIHSHPQQKQAHCKHAESNVSSKRGDPLQQIDPIQIQEQLQNHADQRPISQTSEIQQEKRIINGVEFQPIVPKQYHNTALNRAKSRQNQRLQLLQNQFQINQDEGLIITGKLAIQLQKRDAKTPQSYQPSTSSGKPFLAPKGSLVPSSIPEKEIPNLKRSSLSIKEHLENNEENQKMQKDNQNMLKNRKKASESINPYKNIRIEVPNAVREREYESNFGLTEQADYEHLGMSSQVVSSLIDVTEEIRSPVNPLGENETNPNDISSSLFENLLFTPEKTMNRNQSSSQNDLQMPNKLLETHNQSNFKHSEIITEQTDINQLQLLAQQQAQVDENQEIDEDQVEEQKLEKQSSMLRSRLTFGIDEEKSENSSLSSQFQMERIGFRAQIQLPSNAHYLNQFALRGKALQSGKKKEKKPVSLPQRRSHTPFQVKQIDQSNNLKHFDKNFKFMDQIQKEKRQLSYDCQHQADDKGMLSVCKCTYRRHMQNKNLLVISQNQIKKLKGQEPKIGNVDINQIVKDLIDYYKPQGDEMLETGQAQSSGRHTQNNLDSIKKITLKQLQYSSSDKKESDHDQIQYNNSIKKRSSLVVQQDLVSPSLNKAPTLLKPESDNTSYEQVTNFKDDDERIFTDRMTNKNIESSQQIDSLDQQSYKIQIDSKKNQTRNINRAILKTHSRTNEKDSPGRRLNIQYSSIETQQKIIAEPKTAHQIKRNKYIVIPSHVDSYDEQQDGGDQKVMDQHQFGSQGFIMKEEKQAVNHQYLSEQNNQKSKANIYGFDSVTEQNNRSTIQGVDRYPQISQRTNLHDIIAGEQCMMSNQSKMDDIQQSTIPRHHLDLKSSQEYNNHQLITPTQSSNDSISPCQRPESSVYGPQGKIPNGIHTVLTTTSQPLPDLQYHKRQGQYNSQYKKRTPVSSINDISNPKSVVTRSPMRGGQHSSMVGQYDSAPLTPGSIASTSKPLSPSELTADLILMGSEFRENSRKNINSKNKIENKVLSHYKGMVQDLMRSSFQGTMKKYSKSIQKPNDEDKLKKLMDKKTKQGRSAAALEGTDIPPDIKNEKYHAKLEKEERIKNDQHPHKSKFLSESCKVTDTLFKKYFMNKFKDQVERDISESSFIYNRQVPSLQFGWHSSMSTMNKLMLTRNFQLGLNRSQQIQKQVEFSDRIISYDDIHDQFKKVLAHKNYRSIMSKTPANILQINTMPFSDFSLLKQKNKNAKRKTSNQTPKNGLVQRTPRKEPEKTESQQYFEQVHDSRKRNLSMMDSQPKNTEPITLERKRRDYNNTDLNNVAMTYDLTSPNTPFIDPYTYSASPINNEDRNSTHSMIRDIVIYNQTRGHPIYKDHTPFSSNQYHPQTPADTRGLQTRRSIHHVAPAQHVPPTAPARNLLQMDRRQMSFKNQWETRMDCGDSSYLSNHSAAHVQSLGDMSSFGPHQRASRIIMAKHAMSQNEEFDDSIPFKNFKKQYYRSSKFKALQNFEDHLFQYKMSMVQGTNTNVDNAANGPTQRVTKILKMDSHLESQDSEMLNLAQLENKFTLEGVKGDLSGQQSKQISIRK